MPTEVLGRGVHHDVRAPIERPAEIRRRNRIVDDQRNARFVRDPGERLDVDDVQQRVAERLRVKQLGPAALYGAPKVLRIDRIDERALDAKLGQVDLQQGVRAAV
jgi:hypothetical protein